MTKRNRPKIRTGTYTSSSGVKVGVRGLPPLTIPRLQETIVFPDKPTYDVTTEDGHVETYEHTLESLNSDEDKAVWEEYLEKLEEAETVLIQKTIKAILLEGIDIHPKESADFSRWKKRQALMGMPVSDDEEEMLLHYKETHVIGTPEDIQEVTLLVMELTGVPKKEIDSLVASFPDSVEPDA